MQVLCTIETLQVLCKNTNKYGMMISHHYNAELCPDGSYFEEILKTAPYLSLDSYQAIIDGLAYLLFDTEVEMLEKFDMTVGDDGPTKTNPYNGKCRMYAITCSPNGELGTENT